MAISTVNPNKLLVLPVMGYGLKKLLSVFLT